MRRMLDGLSFDGGLGKLDTMNTEKWRMWADILRHHQDDFLVIIVMIEEMKNREIEVTLQLLASAMTHLLVMFYLCRSSLRRLSNMTKDLRPVFL